MFNLFNHGKREDKERLDWIKDKERLDWIEANLAKTFYFSREPETDPGAPIVFLQILPHLSGRGRTVREAIDRAMSAQNPGG